MPHETQTHNPESEAEEVLFLASVQAWARGHIYTAGLETLADESAQIVLCV